MMLKITIITVAYNSAKTIGDTLNSVRQQTYPNVEHIVVDGASKDNTLAIVQQFPHIQKVISEPDYSVYDAMNKGIKLATGDIVAFLNSDDVYADDRVLERVARLFELKNIDSLYSDLQFFEQDQDNIIRVWNSGLSNRRRFLFGWMPPHPTFFARRAVYEQFGGFDISLRFSADYEIMLRLLYRHGISTHYMQGVSVKMRAGGISNASFANRWKAHCEDGLAWRKNSLQPYFLTVWLKPLLKLEQFKDIYRSFRLFKQTIKEVPQVSLTPVLNEPVQSLELT